MRTDLRAALGSFVYSIIPISIAFHASHYLTALLVDGQYALIAASDPFGTGADLLGFRDHHVTTSFLNTYAGVRTIWNFQTAAIVIGPRGGDRARPRACAPTFRRWPPCGAEPAAARSPDGALHDLRAVAAVDAGCRVDRSDQHRLPPTRLADAEHPDVALDLVAARRSPSPDCPRASPPGGRWRSSPCRPARSARARRRGSGAQPRKSLVRLVPQPKLMRTRPSKWR